MSKRCCGRCSIAMRRGLPQLEAEVAELKARMNQNSQNSSKPPSSDGPHVKRKPPRPASGRKRGGQPGHRAHHRTLVPVEQVNEDRGLYADALSAVWTGVAGNRSAAPSPSSGGTPAADSARDGISTTATGVCSVWDHDVWGITRTVSRRRAMARVSPVSWPYVVGRIG